MSWIKRRNPIKIMELIPEIRKWYSFNGIKAVGEPSKIKDLGYQS